LLCPHRLDITSQYGDGFLGMTVTDLPLDALLKARERLIAEIGARAAATHDISSRASISWTLTGGPSASNRQLQTCRLFNGSASTDEGA